MSVRKVDWKFIAKFLYENEKEINIVSKKMKRKYVSVVKIRKKSST